LIDVNNYDIRSYQYYMATSFFLNELFWGIVTVIGLGSAIIIEMRKSKGLFERLSNLFCDSI
jgi:hypothetical protein